MVHFSLRARACVAMLMLLCFVALPAFASRYDSAKEGGIGKFELHVEKMPITSLLHVLGKQAGANIAVDNDFYRDGKLVSPTITFDYAGVDVEEALELLAQSNDLYWSRVGDSGYVVSRYQTSVFSISRVHHVSFARDTRSYAVTGKNADPSAFSSYLRVAGGDDFPYLSEVAEQIKGLLSDEGAVLISPSGLVTVRDYPSHVCAVKKYLQAEESRRESVHLGIKIVALDSVRSDANREALDWSKGRIVQEWEGSGVLGSTVPFRRMSQEVDVENAPETGFEVFITPTKKNSSEVHAAVYVKYSALSSNSKKTLLTNETNANLIIPVNGSAVVTGLDVEESSDSGTTGMSTKSEYAVVFSISSAEKSQKKAAAPRASSSVKVAQSAVKTRVTTASPVAQQEECASDADCYTIKKTDSVF